MTVISSDTPSSINQSINQASSLVESLKSALHPISIQRNDTQSLSDIIPLHLIHVHRYHSSFEDTSLAYRINSHFLNSRTNKRRLRGPPRFYSSFHFPSCISSSIRFFQ